ncbi:class I SAM-dependent methyltransferase [Aeromicrobium tamlense]|uniref:Class I SAM-dependent methyltransferase n=1 Tax=Aeromicrobium tamlense TaxID=375541 RepID=A0A8I0KI62_9ACTN|nr:cyclopropane-fatty-acyl-phospholipid synthase family protein [Aeromicrobium tamlense]MBD1271746.1 class I SAM-dependent methyltransferase [Aeromicrobium tamlense]NYI37506.1 cyclopropane-fatty-acyl-phospholipid synthase [Aeromicrobium tamlense]
MTTLSLSASHWPTLDLPSPSRATDVRAALARRLFDSAVERLDVSVRIEGRTLGAGGPLMTIHRPDEFFQRLGARPSTGFGESYMTGAWDADDLGAFLTVLASGIRTLVPRSLQVMRGAVMPRPPRDERGDKADTQRVVGHHYDLSNDLFETFLDPTMTYSSALFEETSDGTPVVGGDLEQAQERKLDRLLDLAGVGEGTRLLEIGSGWGSLAMRAARRGARVRTITLSVAQQQLARERIAAAGLQDRIDVDLCDYRDVKGRYDAVVSIEMIEAVGWRHWGTYLATIDRVLAPGGRAAIQAITMPHDRMRVTRNTQTWVTTYIFPGGSLPSVRALEEATAGTSLRLTSTEAIGAHYAETLRQWDESFLAGADEVRALGFDDTFCRMWHFYLQYSRAGFSSGYLDDHHLVFTKESGR